MNIDKKNHFGECMRQVRRKLGVSQGDLADKAAINRSYLSMIENGKSSPTIDVVERLARGLDITVWKLLSAEKEKHFEYDTDEEFEMYAGLKEFLESKDDMLLMNPTIEEIAWLKSGRFGRSFKPTKLFFRELLLAHRKSKL